MPSTLVTSPGSVRCEVAPERRVSEVAFTALTASEPAAHHSLVSPFEFSFSFTWRAAACRYGYSFGAAKANVWHRYSTTAMIYPSYYPVGALGLPRLPSPDLHACTSTSGCMHPRP